MSQSPQVSYDDVEERIEQYVRRLKRGIRTASIEAAFRKVKRHKLIERYYVNDETFSTQGGMAERVNDPTNPKPEDLDLIYSDRVLVTRIGPDGKPSSSTSMPSLMVQMLELLGLEQGHKVLEIGTGTGYNAALMSEIVGDQTHVVTVDIQQDVVEQARRLLRSSSYPDIRIICGDGYLGVPAEAPFDRLIATVGLFDVSPQWKGQLADGGLMLFPMFQGGACPLIRVGVSGDQLAGEVMGMSGFMPIQGELHPDAPYRRPTQGDETDLPLERRSGWPAVRGWEALGLWLYVTAAEPRASLMSVPGKDRGDAWNEWTFGINEGDARVVADGDQLVLIGDAEPLAERLLTLRNRWEAAGCPALHDFSVAFLPKDAHPSVPGETVIERKYHWQVFTPQTGAGIDTASG